MTTYQIHLVCSLCNKKSQISVDDPGTRTDGEQKLAIGILRSKASESGWRNPEGTTLDYCPKCRKKGPKP